MTAPQQPDPRWQQQPYQQPYGQLHQQGGQQPPWPPQPPAGYGAAQPPQGPPPEPAKPKRKVWHYVVGGLVALFLIGQVFGDGGESPAPTPTTAADEAAIPAVDAPVPAPPAAAPVAAAPAPEAPPAPVEPEMTVSQANALRSAESYLDFSGFSRSGLIKQLEFEQYSTADAEFAVDNVSVDWMVQAERSAANYMDFSSFSRSGLIDQLEFEGFTSEQAEHGANSVGL